MNGYAILGTMESTFSLRPATTEDLPKVFEIEKKVHVVPWSVENLRAELLKPYSQFLLFTDDETDSEIAGYIVFWMMFDETQILNVAVDLPYRGLGYAKKMIRKAMAMTQNKGIRKIVLDVRRSNLPAVQLYQAMGFHVTHIRKNYYADGEDAFLMAMNLEQDSFHF